jgi:hypothetical protein
MQAVTQGRTAADVPTLSAWYIFLGAVMEAAVGRAEMEGEAVVTEVVVAAEGMGEVEEVVVRSIQLRRIPLCIKALIFNDCANGLNQLIVCGTNTTT